MAVYGSTSVENNLAGILSECVIPSDAHESQFDHYVMEAVEREYNDLFKSVALAELAAFEESGVVVVYEEASLASLKDRVVKWFKDTWAKIRGAYDKFLEKMDAAAKKFKTSVYNKIGGADKVKEALEKFEDKKVYYKNYNYGKPGEEVKLLTAKAKMISDAYMALETPKSKMETDKKAEDAVMETIKKECKASMDKVIEDLHSSLGVAKDASANDIKNSILKQLRGEGGSEFGYNGAFIKENYQDMLKFVCDISQLKKDVKEPYNKTKNDINKAIAAVKKSKKEDSVQLYTAYAKKVIAINNAVMSANMNYLGNKFAVYRTLVIKVISARVAKNPKVAKEAAEIQSTSSQTELVESLFKW